MKRAGAEEAEEAAGRQEEPARLIDDLFSRRSDSKEAATPSDPTVTVETSLVLVCA